MWNEALVTEVLPKLLKATGYHVEPVLKFLGEKKLPKELSTFAETNAQRLAVAGLQDGGVGRTDAMLRVFLERTIDKGGLPRSAAPKPGEFEITVPNLPAKTTTRVVGRPGLIYNAEEGKSLANPAYMLEHIFGSTHNPALDAAEASEKYVLNAHGNSKSLRPLVRKLGNLRNDKEFVSDVSDGYTKAFPIQEQVEKLWAEREALQNVRAPRVQFAPVGSAPVPNKLAELNRLISEGQTQIDSIYQPIMQKWAARSGGARVMLGAEKMGNPLAHPWLDMAALHPQEQVAAQAVRKLLDKIGGRADEVGIPIIKRGYVPHFMGRILENISKTHPDIAARSRALTHNLPKDLRWQQRSPASRQWWPVVQELQHYIPDAHRKLAFTPVIQKWEPILKKLEAKGYGDVAVYTRNYLNELAHGEQLGRFSKITEFMVGMEYFLKLALSPATAFKHIWKGTRLMAMNPVSAVKTAPKLLDVIGGAAIRHFGMEPGSAYRLTSQMLQARALFHGFSGLDASRGVAGHTLGLLSSMPTAAVEAGERGLGILSTIHKGMALNMPYDTIQQQLYNTLLNVSFIGQVDRYAWLKTPLQRLAFLFYYTPTRITETTAKWILDSAIPQRYTDAAKEGFWETILKGKRRRDPFGTLYATHLARNIAIVGATASVFSSYTGVSPVSLWKIAMAHIPFVRETTRGQEISPPAAMDIPMKMTQLGGITPESFRRVLLDHYNLYTPSKLMRMLEGDIPKAYYGGPLPPQFYYSIGEPVASTMHRIQSEYDRKNVKRLQRQYQQMDKNQRYNVFAQFASWLKKLATGQ